MTSNFTGRSALVTGAASGIGLGAARALAERGMARLVLCDIDGERLAQAAAHLAGPELLLRPGSIGDEAYWDALVPDLTGLDCAVANAGIGGAGLIAGTSLAEWRRVMAVNLDGSFLTLRAAMRAMRGRGGAIVLTGSATGVKAEPGTAVYGSGKAAVHHLARIAAREGAADGIRVNAIAPGGVETAIWSSMPGFDETARKLGGAKAAMDAMAKASTPLGRYATADEIGAQIAFLLSDAAATITGAILVTDGGYSV